MNRRDCLKASAGLAVAQLLPGVTVSVATAIEGERWFMAKRPMSGEEFAKIYARHVEAEVRVQGVRLWA